MREWVKTKITRNYQFLDVGRTVVDDGLFLIIKIIGLLLLNLALL